MNHPTHSHIRTSIHIQQMDCPTEEALLRKKLMRLASVSQMEFNLMQRVLTVAHAPAALQSVLDTVRSLGFTPHISPAQTTLAQFSFYLPNERARRQYEQYVEREVTQ